MSKLLTRTLSGAVYVALFVFCIYSGRIFHNDLVGNLVLGSFLLFVTLVGTYEYFRMFEHHGDKMFKVIGYVMALAVFYFWWNLGFIHLQNPLTEPIMAAMAIPIVWMCPIMALLWTTRWIFPKSALDHTLMPAFYIAAPLGMMPMLNAPQCNVLMMVVLLTWTNDSFAYLGGSLLGKHKLWVRHSPGKTWEGCIVGMLFCVVAAILIGPLFKTSLNLADWAVIGVIVSVIGTLGDLTESMLKRHCGVKDSGNIMPGHGGLLDRFDSLIMITPFVYLYITLF